MNKTSKTLRMILLLSEYGRMSIDELAVALDTNPRNVRAYKEEIKKVGFEIVGTTGRNGGYELTNKKLFIRPINASQEKK